MITTCSILVGMNVFGLFVAAVSKNLNRNISLRAKSYKSKAKKYQLLKISTGEALS
jgi:hypothetical protein